LAWANGRGKRLIKEKKQKISPLRKKKPRPIINGFTRIQGKQNPMHGFKGSFIVPLLYMVVTVPTCLSI
jgi:hypothetical protein